MEDGDESEEFKTRKLNEQGGSIMTTLPKKLVREAAAELDLSLVDFITKYDLSIRVTRGKRGLIDGYAEFTFVERGAEIPTEEAT